jgi:serine/threonine protein kinase
MMILVGITLVNQVSFTKGILYLEISNTFIQAKNFIDRCLTIDVNERITAHQALEHEWLLAADEKKPSEEGGDLLPNLRTNFNARRTFKKAINMITLSNHFGHSLSKHSSTSSNNDEIKPVQEGIDQVLEKENDE